MKQCYGILLTDENIEKLKKANMETISVSIDGFEKTHDEFRWVPGSYKVIINNIKKMKIVLITIFSIIIIILIYVLIRLGVLNYNFAN